MGSAVRGWIATGEEVLDHWPHLKWQFLSHSSHDGLGSKLR